MRPTIPSIPAAARGTWVGTESPLLVVDVGVEGELVVAPAVCVYVSALCNTLMKIITHGGSR